MVGLDNTTAGAKTGSVGLSFGSDGSVSGVSGSTGGGFATINLAAYVNDAFHQRLRQRRPVQSDHRDDDRQPEHRDPVPGRQYAGQSWVGQGAGSSITIPVGLAASTVYTLADNTFGSAGTNEYAITFTPVSGTPITEQYVGGVNTKDYNSNSSTDGTTTTPGAAYWFVDAAGSQWLQEVAWTLPAGSGHWPRSRSPRKPAATPRCSPG